MATHNARYACGAPLTVAAFLRRLERRNPRQLVPTLTPRDFETAAAAVAPSVSLAELRHYDSLRRRFSTAAAAP